MSSWGDELAHPSNELSLDEALSPYLSAVNSRGEVGIFQHYNEADMVIYSVKGESKEIKITELRRGDHEGIMKSGIKALAVDENNNVYVVQWFKTRTEKGEVKSGELYALDNNYNVTHSGYTPQHIGFS